MRSPVAISDRETDIMGEAIVGRSKPIQEVSKAIGRVAPTDATVFIRGASGTGKELVARAIYQHSTRANGPFVVVNCVAIPEPLLESELFGFERGAFTGAVKRRIGKVEQADGGTLFLDEIGDIPLPVQAKLLRLLEDRKIERIGGRDPIPVDVRILAATNRDLESAIDEGRFRSDLFYRLNVVPIHLPPLVDRTDDVALLGDYFMERFALDLGVRNPGLAAEAYPVLEGHSWPGNVRELANLIEQCLIFSRGQRVGPDTVERLLRNTAEEPISQLRALEEAVNDDFQRGVAAGATNVLEVITDRVARQLISEALRHTNGNRSHAARLLGVSRPTLLAKMRKYGLR
jgi:two-component system nitrogen regulation response regulator GlnG